MKNISKVVEIKKLLLSSIALMVGVLGYTQGTLKGEVKDQSTNEPVPFANVLIAGTQNGTTTDFDGDFSLDVASFPVEIEFSFIGYETLVKTFTEASSKIKIQLNSTSINITGADVVEDRITDKQKQQPLTVETMDVLAIKEAPSGNFYEGLGNLKGVDLTSASLGFKVVNTRGFNSTSPVRSLQLIDGVDNQSPGLNFSLGNFLGASDLDVRKVDIIAGASSAFFGPGAFNGVINMETKDPFLFPGISASFKVGERNMGEVAVRWADYTTNEAGEYKFGYKINIFAMRADDWEATNYNPVDDSEHGLTHPFGFDAVNIYGDEPIATNNDVTSDIFTNKGLSEWYRNGYREEDLVDYNTDNFKFNTGLYYYINKNLLATYNFNYSTGSTVFQGDNRFRLENIQFFQNQVELSNPGKWFVRAYATNEDAGDTYDIVTTAIRMQEASGTTGEWNTRFRTLWNSQISPQIDANPIEDDISAQASAGGGLALYTDLMLDWIATDFEYFNNFYQQTVDNVNQTSGTFLQPFYEPGTARFDQLFNDVTSSTFTEGGSRFYDKSALYHIHGEYQIEGKWADYRIGGNARYYTPQSRGTIFSDTLEYVYLTDEDGLAVLDENGRRITTDSSRVVITNREFGFYAGLEKKFIENKLKLNVTARVDKNENFDYLFSPAASVVYSPQKNRVYRLTFSSAVRNPTLADQYLFYDVGRAILLGNIDGRFEAGSDSLFTVDSFNEYRNSGSLAEGLNRLEYFNVDKIRPERARTVELGYRGTHWEKLYVDLGYYLTFYNDFIGYNIGLNGKFDQATGFPDGGIQAYRVASNSIETVITQGFNIGLSYYLKKYSLTGNYSWNKLTSSNDDPIIPAFNTPEHKFNLGFSGRDLTVFDKIKHVGFGINYKWIQGFIFEGSPQFTGFIPSYDMVDAQVNVNVPKWNTTFKLGCSNLLGFMPLFRDDSIQNNIADATVFDNRNVQVFGGPQVGRLAYFSIIYDFNHKR
ncbi:MAG: carboxypeptidase-like regulatory domain-containing protein [Flavobacteriales bacterium]